MIQMFIPMFPIYLLIMMFFRYLYTKFIFLWIFWKIFFIIIFLNHVSGGASTFDPKVLTPMKSSVQKIMCGFKCAPTVESEP